MAGIVSWGAFIAAHRIPASTLAGKAASAGPERSVAWSDEDSITMGVEAARRCLGERARAEVDLLVFATTTAPFDEKQGAALMATALGLSAGARTADIGNSLRCGVQALQFAHEAVLSGTCRQALVVIADCRQGAPGSELERSGGDGAAAFLVGTQGCVARIIAQASHSVEIVDTWRRNGDRFVHSWEDRFVAQYGVTDPLIAAARKLPDAQGERLWAMSAPNERISASVRKALGAMPAPATQRLFDAAGFCGAAHAPLLLAAALDEAATGQEIALLAHGDGAEALLFGVPEGRKGTTVADTLADRIPVTSQVVWRKARGLDTGEYPPADDQGISATIHFRERAENLRLQGQRCLCGEPQFPRGRVCIRCGNKDQFTPEDFAERGASLVTYTLDAFFPSPTPPTMVGIVQVDDGPRIYLQVTDLTDETPRLGMRLRFAFRRIHEVGKRPNYFWKALPERTSA